MLYCRLYSVSLYSYLITMLHFFVLLFSVRKVVLKCSTDSLFKADIYQSSNCQVKEHTHTLTPRHTL